ncbi:MAG: outer membrane lipoprotein carrier protein LolA [Tannerellaceae bacterium]|jgi:outer membrane lipoprotein-sorting protein|nr:outer membrane lipoprotein carrier protein LolA [Tannerellaceae bacterium]
MVKHVFLPLLVFLLTATGLDAQQEASPLSPLAAFQERLKKEAASMTSIESDFVQEKYMDVFQEKILSKGRFYYVQGDRIRMEYTEPVPYLIVINGGKLKVVSEGKSTVVDLHANRMMQEMKMMVSACMTGDLNRLSGAYQWEYSETPSLYVVVIRPLSKSIQAYIHEMTVSLDKRDLSVKTLRLSETAKDYTEYRFTNKKNNTLASDDETFAIP